MLQVAPQPNPSPERKRGVNAAAAPRTGREGEAPAEPRMGCHWRLARRVPLAACPPVRFGGSAALAASYQWHTRSFCAASNLRRVAGSGGDCRTWLSKIQPRGGWTRPREELGATGGGAL